MSGDHPSPSGTAPPPVARNSGDPEMGPATVRAHERTLPSGRKVKVSQHQRQVDRAAADDPAGQQAAAPKAAPVRPKLVQPAPVRGTRPPLKPKPEARKRPAPKPEPVTRPKRGKRGPLVSRAHAAKLARKALRHAQRRHRRGKALAYGALALGEIGAVAGMQGLGLVLATVAAAAGIIATLAFKGSSYR